MHHHLNLRQCNLPPTPKSTPSERHLSPFFSAELEYTLCVAPLRPQSMSNYIEINHGVL